MLKLKKASRQDKRRLANSAVEREAITKEARMKKQKQNFYVIDCETTQIKKPEPICIAVCRYENGKLAIE